MIFDFSYLHNTLLACGATLLFFFSYVLLCSRLCTKVDDVQYIRSRNLVGYVCLVFGLDVLVLWVARDLELAAPVLCAWHTMCLHFASVLMAMAIIHLLDCNFLVPRRIRRDFSLWAVGAVLLWVGATLFNGAAQYAFLLLGVLIYLGHMAHLVSVVLKKCTHAKEQMDNFFSEGADAFVSWIRMSIFVVAVLGIVSLSAPVLPDAGHVVLLLGAILGWSYTFITFLNHVVAYGNVSSVIYRADELGELTQDETTAALQEEQVKAEEAPVADAGAAQTEPESNTMEDRSSLTERLMRENLEKWIMKGGYLKQGTTLEDLSSELMTNRTYLSAYINNTYSCTFKEFIYMLRIEAAIQIMIAEPQINVEDLGGRVGIPSASTFNRQFVKQMGVTPAVWKMTNLQNVG